MANRIIVSGTVAENPEYSHEVFGEKFYRFFIDSKRISETVDRLPVMISEVMMKNVIAGERITVDGEIRTFNQHTEEKSKLLIYVFAKRIEEYKGKDDNYVEMDGYICKKPIYRETPLGREITDVLVASQRGYRYGGKSDYIPTISWGRIAKRISESKIGERLFIVGRLQSREFEKHLENGKTEKRIAYEISTNIIRNPDWRDDYSWINSRK